MKAKSDLTTVHGEKRKKEEEKRQLDEKRKEAENRLKLMVNTTADLKSQIESQKARTAPPTHLGQLKFVLPVSRQP